ncbi:hypothetical protein E4U54_000616 [Claviceps lovelessii]|nr:hypothetical protein E4U54_000616 [Claviceps lovelessii]
MTRLDSPGRDSRRGFDPASRVQQSMFRLVRSAFGRLPPQRPREAGIAAVDGAAFRVSEGDWRRLVSGWVRRLCGWKSDARKWVIPLCGSFGVMRLERPSGLLPARVLQVWRALAPWMWMVDLEC